MTFLASLPCSPSSPPRCASCACLPLTIPGGCARQANRLLAATSVVARDRDRDRDRDRASMDDACAPVAQMNAAETDLLQERSTPAQATERRLLAVTILCTRLSLAARIAIGPPKASPPLAAAPTPGQETPS